jgi:outer membrane protein OmpA-like peptidoglycan-associated protein
VRYEGKPVTVQIGGASTVELPPAVYRGRLVGMLFDFDKTFVLPTALPGLRELRRVWEKHPGAGVLVVGHADHRGKADYNARLSLERAKAIAALLRADAAAWAGCFQQQPAGRPWGKREEEAMRRHLGATAPAARPELIAAYLDAAACALPAGTTIETHGCGESHPEDEGDDEQAMRQNRRVEVFLFEGPIEPAAGECPATTGCTQHAEWVKRSVETIDFTEAPENALEVIFGWPEDVVDRLGDVTLHLGGETVARQQRSLRSARREHGWATVQFGWLDREAVIDLEARSPSRKVTLLTAQQVGELEQDQVHWEAELESLLDDASEADGDEQPRLIGRAEPA